MVEIRFPSAEPARSLAVAVFAATVGFFVLGIFVPFNRAEAGAVRDAPIVWYADDEREIPEPQERDPNLLWDQAKESVVRPFGRWTRPSRLLRHAGSVLGVDHARPAANVNALDEVPNSAWFTNRIGLFPMTAEEVGRGPGGTGPDLTSTWTIVSAKTQGVTPGFNIRDSRGDVYLIKFDPPEFPGMASSADVISSRLLHAAGYNVPEDHVVYFTREMLALGEGVQIKLPDGARRPMTEADVDAILSVVRSESSRWRAISSKFLNGVPIGPFDYQGQRSDDPNDLIAHEHRRELRGLYVFAAWITHFDTKQHNSLDMYVEEDGQHFVRHYLIDFASTLGTGARGPVQKWGHEFTVDLFPFLGRSLALGFHEDTWRRLQRPPGLVEVGTFESEHFDPTEFKPLIPNPAFANVTDRDAYWAAKIISAFTREQLLAACNEAHYEDPRAAETVARILDERRVKVARAWFDRIPPLDFFRLEPGSAGAGEMAVHFRDLGRERGVYAGMPALYRARCAAVDGDRSAAKWSGWAESAETRLDLGAQEFQSVWGEADAARFPFVAIQCEVDRGGGWSSPVTVYVARETRRVVAVDR